MDVLPPRSIFYTAVLAAVCGAVLAWSNSGCGAGAKACAVIDLAEQSCQVIRYLDADGGVASVQVDREELQGFVAGLTVKRAAAGVSCDGGCDSGGR